MVSKFKNIPAWITISVTIIGMLVGGGVAYGQMKTKVDTLQTEVDTIKIQVAKKIEKIEKEVTEQKVSQERTNIMLELLLQKEGITIPRNN